MNLEDQVTQNVSRLNKALEAMRADIKKAIEACRIAKEELTRPMTTQDIQERDKGAL